MNRLIAKLLIVIGLTFLIIFSYFVWALSPLLLGSKRASSQSAVQPLLVIDLASLASLAAIFGVVILPCLWALLYLAFKRFLPTSLATILIWIIPLATAYPYLMLSSFQPEGITALFALASLVVSAIGYYIFLVACAFRSWSKDKN